MTCAAVYAALLERGLRIGELHFDRLAGARKRLGHDAQVREVEIAILGPARPSFDQRRIGQGLDPHGGDLGQVGLTTIV